MSPMVTELAVRAASRREVRATPTPIYSYFQVNRPHGRGTAMLIGVNLT